MYLGIPMQQVDINVNGRLQIAMLSPSYKVTGANGNPDELVRPANQPRPESRSKSTSFSTIL